ncbi:hypothetical protein M885DRAFT_576589 [Pelagophyceae sp. CCMP2097]|nr:hypothetical protein M885DRAFT_576589 [Pelagophyceae sp. CCMP2097]
MGLDEVTAVFASDTMLTTYAGAVAASGITGEFLLRVKDVAAEIEVVYTSLGLTPMAKLKLLQKLSLAPPVKGRVALRKAKTMGGQVHSLNPRAAAATFQAAFQRQRSANMLKKTEAAPHQPGKDMRQQQGDERHSGLCARVDASAREMAAMPHSQRTLEFQPEFQSMLLEFALSAKIISPDHPAVASLTRLLLRVIHMEHSRQRTRGADDADVDAAAEAVKQLSIEEAGAAKGPPATAGAASDAEALAVLRAEARDEALAVARAEARADAAARAEALDRMRRTTGSYLLGGTRRTASTRAARRTLDALRTEAARAEALVVLRAEVRT